MRDIVTAGEIQKKIHYHVMIDQFSSLAEDKCPGKQNLSYLFTSTLPEGIKVVEYIKFVARSHTSSLLSHWSLQRHSTSEK